MQHRSSALLPAARLRHRQLGVGDPLPDEQGRGRNGVLHQGVVPHERQHLVGKFQGGLEPFSLQSAVQTLKKRGEKETSESFL